VPTYVITAPDGRKFRITGEGSKEDALAHIQSQYGARQTAQPQQPASPLDGMGAVDRLRAGAGKAFADLGRGARQLSTGIGNAVGLGRLMPANFGDQEIERQREEHADTTQRDAALMNTGMGKIGNFAGNLAVAAPAAFVPGANTVAGAGLVGAGMGLLQPAASGNERMMNTGLGAAFGAGGQYLGSKAAAWAGDKLAQRTARAATEKAQNAGRDQVVREAIDAGYAVPPATHNPSAKNVALESIAGKAATQSAASVKNQKVTNTLIRRDLGIADDVPLSRDVLKSVRTEAGKAYQAIEQAGDVIADQQYLDDVVDLVGGNSEVSKQFPGAKVSADKDVLDLADTLMQEKFTAKAAVEYAKRLRSQSKENFKTAYASGGSAEKLQLARAQWDAAGALEDAIERNLASQGRGNLVEQFRQARVQIAKSYSAEAALNEGTGNIVASKLVNQLRKGKPLSGGFEQVAKFASTAPKAMAEPTQSGGVSALSAAIAAGGIGMGQPGLLAIPVGRVLTKHAILSQKLQKRMALPNYQPGLTGTAALQATRGLGRIAAPAGTSANATKK
jgi:hypothetical protein